MTFNPPKCVWMFDDREETWNSDCGLTWALNEGTPRQNEMVYCLRCGRILKEESPKAASRRRRK